MTSPNTLGSAITNSVLYQLMNVHTSFPAQIVSYDYTKKRASVQPLIDKKYTDGVVQPMPILNNVPVVFPTASGFSMTYPVNPGDYCLVSCCERSISDWLTSGNQGPPSDPRRLDLSDGVAIMGLQPFSNPIPASNNTDFVLSYNGSSITIDGNGNIILDTSNTVAIGNSTTELLSVVSQLMTYLQGPTVMGAAFGGPLNPAFVSQVLALQTQLNLITGVIP
jgi:hypothetical protein